jgi:hypothetical protein
MTPASNSGCAVAWGEAESTDAIADPRWLSCCCESAIPWRMGCIRAPNLSHRDCLATRAAEPNCDGAGCWKSARPVSMRGVGNGASPAWPKLPRLILVPWRSQAQTIGVPGRGDARHSSSKGIRVLPRLGELIALSVSARWPPRSAHRRRIMRGNDQLPPARFDHCPPRVRSVPALL